MERGKVQCMLVERVVIVVVVVAPRARMPLVRAKVRCANAMRGTEINDQVGSSCILRLAWGQPTRGWDWIDGRNKELGSRTQKFKSKPRLFL